jgi:hypothetical protein
MYVHVHVHVHVHKTYVCMCAACAWKGRYAQPQPHSPGRKPLFVRPVDLVLELGHRHASPPDAHTASLQSDGYCIRHTGEGLSEKKANRKPHLFGFELRDDEWGCVRVCCGVCVCRLTWFCVSARIQWKANMSELNQGLLVGSSSSKRKRANGGKARSQFPGLGQGQVSESV